MRIEDRYVVIERPEATLRVILLHHGGGSAMSLRALAARLPATCEPVLFELPGRGIRVGEPVARDFAAALADFTVTAEHLTTRPLAIVGQSLGALLAHGLSVRLAETPDTDVRAVVLVGCAAPSVVAADASWPAAPFQARSRTEVEQRLRTGGDCAPEVLAEPAFLAATVELFGNDLHLADTYHAPGPDTGSAEYHVWSGGDDPNLPPEKLAGWRDTAARPPVFRQFPGGHLLLGEREPQAALHELLTRHSAGRRSMHAPGARHHHRSNE